MSLIHFFARQRLFWEQRTPTTNPDFWLGGHAALDQAEAGFRTEPLYNYLHENRRLQSEMEDLGQKLSQAWAKEAATLTEIAALRNEISTLRGEITALHEERNNLNSKITTVYVLSNNIKKRITQLAAPTGKASIRLLNILDIINSYFKLIAKGSTVRVPPLPTPKTSRSPSKR